MSTLMKILVALGLDSSDYDKGLDKAEGKAKSSTKNIAASFQDVGASMQKIGGVMTAAITAPIVAMGVKAVGAASDLNETVSKVGVVFGESAAEVMKFGETSAQAIGMSKNEALSAAGTYGNLFRAMGITEQTSAKMSTSLVQLAGDLASFNNMDPSEVLDKLRAGLAGETEPLRSLGVNLNQATIEAKAMALGLWDGNGAIDAASKAQATYALILEQTSLAQGDFARTSSGLANQQRILKAEFDNALATLGQNLLPIALQAVGVLNQLLTAFNNLTPAQQTTIVTVLAVVAAIGPLVTVLGTLLSAIGSVSAFFAGPAAAACGTFIAAALPIIAAVAAIIAIIASWIWMAQEHWKNLQIIASWIQGTFGPVLQALANLMDAVVGLAVKVLTGLWENKFLPAIQKVGAFLDATFGPGLRAIASVLRDVFGPAIEWAQGLIDKVKGAFEGLGGVVQKVAGWINDLADKIRNIKLPDDLTPGSPTPFEMGLRGIGAALTDLSNTRLPKFQAELDYTTPSGALALSGAGGASGGTTNNTYNIFTKDNPGRIDNALTLSRMMGGAA